MTKLNADHREANRKRQEKFRLEKHAESLKEVRGIYASDEDEKKIKDYAKLLKQNRKC